MILGLLAALVAAPPVALLTIYAVEIVAGLRPLAPVANTGPTPSTVVLIPAHNEAVGISATIAALRADSDPAIDLLVVADNCSDDTAMRARALGVRVVERTDGLRRGKGYALAFGRDAMAGAPPACVVVLDADCVVAGTGVVGLARAAVAAGRAVQACNLQRPDRSASATAQISNFAFLVKNLVRQRGMVRLGGVAAMTGTGMAIPWPLFAVAPLATGDLAEDMALGVWLARSGTPPRFLQSAQIWSDAASGSALLIQRRRWETGFLSIARQQALPLIVSGTAQLSRGQFWLGLHVLVPPLALLFLGAGTTLAVTLLLGLAGASLVPAATLTLALLVAGVATIAAWGIEGREQVSGEALLRAPLYIAAKLPLYRSLLRRGSGEGWIRTRRKGEHDAQ